MLTEKDAWVVLSVLWDRQPADAMLTYQEVEGVQCLGLCSSIRALYRAGRVSDKVADRMLARLDKIGNIGSSYFWPTDAFGAKARARFCKTQRRTLWDWFLCR
jgi:hypothetical protein